MSWRIYPVLLTGRRWSAIYPLFSTKPMLDHYREELTRFYEALGREQYCYFSGQKDRLELRPIFDRYSDLFREDTIQELKRALDQTPEHFQTQREGIRRLIACTEEHVLERSVAELTEQIAEREGRAIIGLNGSEVPFHRITELMAHEPDAARRRQMNEHRLAVIRQSLELREERVRRLHEGSRHLGYDSYWSMVENWPGSALRRTADDFGDFLSRTDDLYFRHLERELTASLSLRLDEADRADVERFLQLDEYADLFPAEGVIPAYRETLRELHIDLDEQPNIDIDDIERPRKIPRAFCIPIRVPEEIKLSISPRGGVMDYEAMLHEGGHAQHYAWTSPRLPVEFKLAGDAAVTEGYAFLFQYLVLDPLWLDDLLRFPGSQSLVISLWLRKLFFLRRYVAKLRCEHYLHTTGALSSSSLHYARTLTEATGFRYTSDEFLHDLDDYIYAASYLRGWLFEVQLREFLRTRFGHKWWKSKKAAHLLIDLWNAGERYPVDELASLADLGTLSVEPLIDEVMEVLS